MARSRNGSGLTQMLAERGLSQTDLASILDVDRSQVSRYVNGFSDPTLSGFRAMREALGVTADALLAAIDKAKPRHRRRRAA